MTHPDSRRPQASDLCAPGGLQAAKVAATRDTDKPDTDKNLWSANERMLGKLECSFYLINLFSEFQTPYLPFS